MNNPKETTMKVTKELRDYLMHHKIDMKLNSLEESIWSFIKDDSVIQAQEQLKEKRDAE